MKKLIQLSIFLILIIVSFSFYFNFLKTNKTSDLKEIEIKENSSLLESDNNLIKNLEYNVTFDNNTKYTITAELSELKYEDDIEIVEMQFVTAIFNDKDGIPLIITSKISLSVSKESPVDSSLNTASLSKLSISIIISSSDSSNKSSSSSRLFSLARKYKNHEITKEEYLEMIKGEMRFTIIKLTEEYRSDEYSTESQEHVDERLYPMIVAHAKKCLQIKGDLDLRIQHSIQSIIYAYLDKCETGSVDIDHNCLL